MTRKGTYNIDLVGRGERKERLRFQIFYEPVRRAEGQISVRPCDVLRLGRGTLPIRTNHEHIHLENFAADAYYFLRKCLIHLSRKGDTKQCWLLFAYKLSLWLTLRYESTVCLSVFSVKKTQEPRAHEHFC